MFISIFKKFAITISLVVVSSFVAIAISYAVVWNEPSVPPPGGSIASVDNVWSLSNNNISNTNSGNVGIGTTAPSTLTEIASPTVDGATLLLNSTSLTQGNRAALFMRAGNVNGFTGNVSIEALSVNNVQADMVFRTGATTLTAFGTERMRITTAGNVGIGTPSPDTNYKITTTAGGIKAENSSASQPSGYFSNAGGGPSMVTGSGNVGIGTASPGSYKLDVNGTMRTTALQVGNNFYIADEGNHTIFAGGGTERLIAFYGGAWTNLSFGNLSANGSGNNYFASNVGIGTASPASILSIQKDNNWIQLDRSSTNAYLGIVNSTAGINKWFTGLREGNTSNRYSFYNFTNNTEPMAILENGNVGIGTPSPAYKLDVAGEIRATGGTAIYSCPSRGNHSACPLPCIGQLTLSSVCYNLAGGQCLSVMCGQVGRMVAP